MFDTKDKQISIQNLTEKYITGQYEGLELFKMGTKNRTIASTSMNDRSSRSHSIFTISILQRDNECESIKSGKLYLVDLAGSEKVYQSHGSLFEETKNINKSLLCLGNVINALTEAKGKSTHIPFRDSKLTRILQECFGGNSLTTLIINCSPSSLNERETLSSLRFGVRAKKICNKIVNNTQKSIKELLAKINEQEIIIQTLEEKINAFTKENTKSEEVAEPLNYSTNNIIKQFEGHKVIVNNGNIYFGEKLTSKSAEALLAKSTKLIYNEENSTVKTNFVSEFEIVESFTISPLKQKGDYKIKMAVFEYAFNSLAEISKLYKLTKSNLAQISESKTKCENCFSLIKANLKILTKVVKSHSSGTAVRQPKNVPNAQVEVAKLELSRISEYEIKIKVLKDENQALRESNKSKQNELECLIQKLGSLEKKLVKIFQPKAGGINPTQVPQNEQPIINHKNSNKMLNFIQGGQTVTTSNSSIFK